MGNSTLQRSADLRDFTCWIGALPGELRIVTVVQNGLPKTGKYHWRLSSEAHTNEPATVANLQDVMGAKDTNAYREYSIKSYEVFKGCILLDFDLSTNEEIPIEEVEP
ncbi:glutamate synthase [NADH] [Basidiobolus ranarum]|uniref:Glutamate synthase [NADH] n=1 Tax=Basidiobolus ranarum TaxID=34480 RepID=A0ABR2W160_9FUNG